MSELMNEEIQQDIEFLTEEEKRFVCDDDQKADWLLRKRAEAIAEFDIWKEFYEEQIRKTEVAMNRKIAWVDFMLEGYFRMVPHKESKTQESYLLPSGKLVMKKPAVVLEHNDELLLPWVKQNKSGFIKTKESVDWAGLKKELLSNEAIDPAYRGFMTDDGEIIPGINRVEKPAEFKVEVK